MILLGVLIIHEDVEAVKKVTLLLLILAFVASSITLWLLESPLKPP